MKSYKSMLRRLLVVATFVVAFLAMGIIGEAASASYPSKIRIYPKSAYETFEVTYPERGAYISKLKSSSKNLLVKWTSHSEEDGSDVDEYASNDAVITIYAKKAGTYKVTFNICSAKGKVLKKATVTVYAKSDSAIKKATFAGKKFTYGLTTKKSGKFKVNMTSGYKLKKIEYLKYTPKKKGDGTWETTEKWVKIKNGGTVKLNTVGYCSSSKASGGDETSDYWWKSSSWNDSLIASTPIRVTYIDKYTKEVSYIYYTLNRLCTKTTVK